MSVARDRSAQRPRGGGGRLLRPEPYESNVPANTWAFTIRRERRPARLSARLWSFGRASPSGSQAVSVGPQITRNRVAQKRLVAVPVQELGPAPTSVINSSQNDDVSNRCSPSTELRRNIRGPRGLWIAALRRSYAEAETGKAAFYFVPLKALLFVPRRSDSASGKLCFCPVLGRVPRLVTDCEQGFTRANFLRS